MDIQKQLKTDINNKSKLKDKIISRLYLVINRFDTIWTNIFMETCNIRLFETVRLGLTKEKSSLIIANNNFASKRSF